VTVIKTSRLFYPIQANLKLIKPACACMNPHATSSRIPFRLTHTSCHRVHVNPFTTNPVKSLRLYTLPYWSNPPLLISDIRALWCSVLSARAPEHKKLIMVGYTSMALNPSRCSNLEQVALKGLNYQLTADSNTTIQTV